MIPKLITDINSNVPAIITRTGKQIIVKGRSQDDLLEISFLNNDTDVRSGDLIVTSGQAGRFIASLNIGRVIEIIRNEGERFATVIIEPSEYINTINEIIVTQNNRLYFNYEMPNETNLHWFDINNEISSLKIEIINISQEATPTLKCGLKDVWFYGRES